MSLDAIIPHIPGDLGRTMWTLLTLTAALALLFSALCGPLFGTLTEIFYLKTRKMFYEKCALQLTRFVSLVGLAAGVVVVAAGYFLLRRHMPELLAPPFGMRLIFFLLVPGMGYGLFLVRRVTWTGLNHLPKTRFLLGLLPATLGLALMGRIILPLEQVQAFAQNPQAGGAGGALLEALSPGMSLDAVLFSRIAYALFIGLAGTAVFGAWYLFWRRNREDFGRDYYSFALKFCARWGAGLTVAAAAAAWWVLQGLSLPPTGGEDPLLLRFACTATASLICCLLLLCMGKSAVPLRHKPTAFFAGFFFLAAMFGHLLLFYLAAIPVPAL